MDAKPYLVIEPKKGWQLINFRELKEYKDLLYFFVTRNVRVRYKQTMLGGLWAIIQPFFMMIVFSVFFGRLAKVPSDNIPYPIFSYSAMVAWTYFATAISSSSNSLVQEQTLISKVYFPRLIAPLAPVFSGLLDFAVAFIVLIGMMFYYRVYPNIMTVFLPVLIFLMMLTAAGVGMFLSALNAKYRDIGYAVPFVVQFWMFASPVVYPLSLLPQKYHLIYAVNPMSGIIEGFRSALLGTVAFPTGQLLISAVVSMIVFMGGALYFKRTERYFADVM
jgi:lipopolysaccharide transport system permease protein